MAEVYNKTDAEILADKLKADAFNAYLKLGSFYELGMFTFWKNGKVTPQEAAAALGTQGVKVFALYAECRAAVLSLNPNASLIAPTTYGTWQENPDGTVTILTVN